MSYILFVLAFTLIIFIYNIYVIYRIAKYNEDRIPEAIAIDIVAIITIGIGIVIYIANMGGLV